MAKLLGRVEAPDDRHLQRFSLTADTMPTEPTACVFGSAWYWRWFTPHRDSKGISWLVDPALSNRPDMWGGVAGGHAYCAKPVGRPDDKRYWLYYDQQRNDCVGYSSSRAQSIHNGPVYDAAWVYDRALERDEWEGTRDEGTSVRAGMEVLRTLGMRVVRRGKTLEPDMSQGIEAYRWCRNIEQMAAVLSPRDNGRIVLNRGYVLIGNSWGPDNYPYSVRAPLDTLDIVLFRDQGDCTLISDR